MAHPGELDPRPTALGPPQRKLVGRKAPVFEPPSPRWPTPHYLISPDALKDPMFAPPPPPRGYWLHAEIPPYKLRGLGPADSIILRHALSRGLFDVDNLVLTPLVPWVPPPLAAAGLSRNLVICPDAPLQPDAAHWVEGDAEIIEIKPNAGYAAFGQTLTYAWAWNRHFGDRWPARPAILTDQPRAYLFDLCAEYGVTVYALGELLVEPPPFPT